MPTYAYACTECDHRFEQHQAFSDAALTQCPQCSGRLRKVFNSVGIVFKGSGFYRTDSRKDSATAASAAAPESKDGKGSESKDAKTSESKTEKPSSPGKDGSSSSKPSPSSSDRSSGGSSGSAPASGSKTSAA